jgi:hypothetical protein
MQLAYNINMGIANPGMIADAAFDMIESFQAYEVINLGIGIIKRVGSDYQGRIPRANKAKVVFSGDFSGTDAVTLTVNGTGITSTVFATTHLAMVQAIIAKLNALTTIVLLAYIDTTDATNRTIYITTLDGLDSVVTYTASVGGITGTVTKGSSDVLEGVSVSTMAKEETLGTLLVQFAIGEAIPVMRKGKIYVFPTTAVASGDAVYCRFYVDGTGLMPAGSFGNVNTDGLSFIVSDAFWKTTAVAGAPAILEINRP